VKTNSMSVYSGG